MHPLEPIKRSLKWKHLIKSSQHIQVQCKKDLKQLSKKRGIYFIMHDNRVMLYIGVSNNLGYRVDVYRRINIGEVNRYLYCILKDIKRRKSYVTYHALVLDISGNNLSKLETYLIQKLRPICNRLVSYSWANRV